ncbi:methylmalonyl-CoA epimerase [miscellaneous Crenarchaeota group-15 archaeon DG-45]|uniref:Methylmalonyl-CoA epimerase n=1 Tax=miscellaneous Crenarchaeota group-15 archaeon DG-45 TaxID=1685127 RepID=A0A0M0BR29_9ARCH|nr:MAG: methylmalonyl-CoA epimerase [miscellaneous Crenarchaeota group-15 archaeon DG-45]
MIKNVAHIGVAVRSLDEALGIYRDALGLEVAGIEEVEEQRVRTAFIPVGGTQIELLESTSPDGPVGRFISSRGEGIHHIALNVEGIEGLMEKLKKQGVRLIDERPRVNVHGRKYAFVHPKSMAGVLVELCEAPG